MSERSINFNGESWTKTQYYCPCCGAKGFVWQSSDDDYYSGSPYLCTFCSVGWFWPIEPGPSDSYKRCVNAIRTRDQEK
jgi:hypothetical protein